MGANLDSPPTPAELSAYAPSGRLRLLLLGVSWERKGGAIALEALKALRARGVDASLTICGCTPPEGVEDPQMEVIPFLNKNDPEQARRLRSLLINSDCLLLPTQAECFGIVFSEASAFGLPSIAPDTGGVATAVVDGVNGVVLPADASGGDYARALEALFHDGERLMALRRSSRRLYETSHNWDAWAQAVAPLVVRAAGGALR
jgi:glycosyltransferase involved in cell wall biosynthesis